MTKHRQTVAVNEFVLRQIEGSGKTFSHDLTFQQIAEYAENNGYKPADVADLASIVESIIAERIDFVKERGMGAMGPLMGVVMQAAAGADGKQVSALLREAIQKAIE